MLLLGAILLGFAVLDKWPFLENVFIVLLLPLVPLFLVAWLFGWVLNNFFFVIFILFLVWVALLALCFVVWPKESWKAMKKM